jgi:hypothetical protein
MTSANGPLMARHGRGGAETAPLFQQDPPTQGTPVPACPPWSARPPVLCRPLTATVPSVRKWTA